MEFIPSTMYTHYRARQARPYMVLCRGPRRPWSCGRLGAAFLSAALHLALSTYTSSCLPLSTTRHFPPFLSSFPAQAIFSSLSLSCPPSAPPLHNRQESTNLRNSGNAVSPSPSQQYPAPKNYRCPPSVPSLVGAPQKSPTPVSSRGSSSICDASAHFKTRPNARHDRLCCSPSPSVLRRPLATKKSTPNHGYCRNQGDDNPTAENT